MATHVPDGGLGGGMVRYVVELARALNRRSDIDLHVVSHPTAFDWWASQLGDPARVIKATSLPRVLTALAERTGRDPSVDTTSFDVVHGPKHLLPARATGVRVLTVHDMLPLDRPDDFGLLKRTLLRKPYLRSVAEADVLVCVSAATRDRMASYVRGSRSHSTVVGLAPSPSLLAAPTQPIESLVGTAFALVVGDPSARKNLSLVLDIWPQVISEAPAAVLAVLGPEGWRGTSIDASVAKMQQQGHVQLLGHVSEGNLRWAYENASVVVIPSLLEGFGLPAVEARAFGSPLLISEDPALCEAAAGYGIICYSRVPQAWIRELVSALSHDGRMSPEQEPRGWDAVALETVAAVRRFLESDERK